ncbi:YdbH family protein [Tatumella citrea]|uniref:Dicarboxylate transport domain-containing protein n=2 Tax=Tatumella citrea TaxID=53336 RepID=A0ABM6KVA0_TATCI|nr:YdbH family protein [Tatumella citrea]ARU98122.1 hypothetical protein A7K99_10040 [Tatumella citrea]
MKGKATGILVAVPLLLLLFLAAVGTVNLWLPRLAVFWLPKGVTLEMHGHLRPGFNHLKLPDITLRAGDCEAAVLHAPDFGYRDQLWQITAEQVRLDSQCLAKLPESPSSTSTAKTLASWQSMLPAFQLSISQLQIRPWSQYSASVHLLSQHGRQTLTLEGEQLHLDAELNQKQLLLRQLSLTVAGLSQPLNVSGSITLAELTNQLPQTGRLNGQLSIAEIPLSLAFHWQQQQGELTLTTPGQSRPLLNLPWTVTPQSVDIHQGQWFWPFAGQPLQGGLAVSAENWSSGLDNIRFSGRMNVLTSGLGGKGNAVLSFGPGKLSLAESDLPLRLTGNGGAEKLQFFASLPARLTGPLLMPEVRFLSGALLRVRGRILDTLQVDEARWPLAGVRLSTAGVSGPLQAILKLHEPAYGQYRLQLSGKADHFWPDNGRWAWRYWGNGYLRPLQAHWDIHGQGLWDDKLITVQTLSTGLDRIKFADITAESPRLLLSKPLHWSRDIRTPEFSGEFLLTTGVSRFGYGGSLAAGKLPVTIRGSSPDNFQYQAQLTAGEAGPLISRGRWDGQRLRGQLWWPSQPLQVFQSLAKPTVKMKLTGGTLRGQAAFSVSGEEGFQAGGHWVISQGSLWTPDNQISGVDFSLPFRYHRQRWQFGYHQPVHLTIGRVTNQIAISHITASLQGYYPWSESHPLALTDVSMSLLDGTMSLSDLRLPQHQPAVLKAENISLSPLITALHPKQIAMSGRVDGELPLLVDDPHYVVRNGWIKNNGPLTLRVDKDLIDSITSNNMAAGVAVDWLRYMEISRSEATLQLTSNGELTMKSKVQGTSRFSNKDQRVNLNYTHQENVFMLWRSLSFADNLQSQLSQHLKLPAEKELNQ